MKLDIRIFSESLTRARPYTWYGRQNFGECLALWHEKSERKIFTWFIRVKNAFDACRTNERLIELLYTLSIRINLIRLFFFLSLMFQCSIAQAHIWPLLWLLVYVLFLLHLAVSVYVYIVILSTQSLKITIFDAVEYFWASCCAVLWCHFYKWSTLNACMHIYEIIIKIFHLKIMLYSRLCMCVREAWRCVTSALTFLVHLTALAAV